MREPDQSTQPLTVARVRHAGHAAAAALLLLIASGAPSPADFRGVTIVDDEFRPSAITVRVGDTVVWQHEGQRPHGVRSDSGAFDSSPGCSFGNTSPCLKNGDRYSLTFRSVGTFFYFCPVHGAGGGVGMSGQVTVASSSTSSTTAPATSKPPTTKQATTTTARPTSSAPTTAAPTTQGGSGTTAAPTTSADVVVTPTTRSTGRPPTTLVVGGPTPDEGGAGPVLAIAGLIVLAAALSAAAWYYRPRRTPPPPPA